jgi:methyl-accepting chemotaxis protein
MHEAQQALTALARGDLSQAMGGTYEGELDKIKVSLNTALTNLA